MYFLSTVIEEKNAPLYTEHLKLTGDLAVY